MSNSGPGKVVTIQDSESCSKQFHRDTSKWILSQHLEETAARAETSRFESRVLFEQLIVGIPRVCILIHLGRPRETPSLYCIFLTRARKVTVNVSS